MSQSSNFWFLAEYDQLFVDLGAAAERNFAPDPNTTLVKLRQFGELLAHRWVMEIPGKDGDSKVSIDDLSFMEAINLAAEKRAFGNDPQRAQFLQIYHRLRIVGNKAVHQFTGDHSEALAQLKVARLLAIQFHSTIGDTTFKAGPFIPPVDHDEKAKQLKAELARLKKLVDKDTTASARYKDLADATQKELQDAKQRAAKFAADSKEWQDFAQSLEDEFRAKLAEKDATLKKSVTINGKSKAEIEALVANALKAAGQLQLDEQDARAQIDAQLREAGWNADSHELTYANGARPAKNINQAIAEWPTKSGPADYVLFLGMTPVATVEAKKQRKDVSGALEQSKRYSRDFDTNFNAQFLKTSAGPWQNYYVPFMFSTNGRPFIRQLRTKSGIWFYDGRHPNNISRPLEHWYTPEGIKKLLKLDPYAAAHRLKADPVNILPMRPYQQDAITAIEEALAAGNRREFLLAMATGTGKTRTAIGLIYRLVKAQRFQRVLFVVDRTSLGEQATEAFKSLKLEQNQTFADIYNIKELGDVSTDTETRLHFATIQSLIRRLFFSEDEFLPVDQYDCIVVDEAHRGYNLDRELSDSELTFRNENDFRSKYTRVLDHFDAVKIALTATPALHTTKLFGKPIYEYSYRQAVLDGFLIDHEPPLRILTKLANEGISYAAGEEVLAIDTTTNETVTYNTPDEIDFQVESFNKRVLSESFNQVVCESLARNIDPTLDGKTLIFCATDQHADTVVDTLKRVFKEHYGSIEDDAVVKITGAADKPLRLIKRFKNEANPKIAVTVDLLTTGIDVPKITNLVFMRRVRSRILYEQMIGRATRICKEIGKETFRIFDAVDIYASLQKMTDMKPVVTQTNISFEQLVDELSTIEITEQQLSNASKDQEARKQTASAKSSIVDQYIAKLQRKAPKLQGNAKVAFEDLAGESAKDLAQRLRTESVDVAAKWLQQKAALAKYLDKISIQSNRRVVISEHPDELLSEEVGFGGAKNNMKPGDYLESFKQFLTENLNEIEALLVVTQRPRELTRAHLKELKKILDDNEFSEPYVRAAWREHTNQDIAARIIGFVRQQAIGSPLKPYEERVSDAVKQILQSRKWTNPQRKWLERIGKQMKQEIVVDRDALDRGVFKSNGGFERMNKVFEGQLEQILGDFNEAVWNDAG